MGNLNSIQESLAESTQEEDYEQQQNSKAKSGDGGSFAFSISDLQQSESFRILTVEQFHQCIAAFPKKLSNYYLKALKLKSKILQVEAPEIKFLQCDDFNPWAASYRCLQYWNLRKQVFGGRAYHPLTQSSSDGALKEIDIEMLQSGALSLGVFEAAGTQEGLVLGVDIHKLRSLDQQHDPAAPLRCIFYLLTVCVDSDEALKGGVTFVLFVDNNMNQCISDLASWKSIIDVFPIIPDSIHVVPCSMSEQPDSTVETHQLAWEHEVELKLYANHAQGDLLAALVALGIPLDLLPERIGGSGVKERALSWQQERSRIELERYGASDFSRARVSSEASGSTQSLVHHHKVSSRLKAASATAHASAPSHRPQATSKKRKAKQLDLDKDTSSLDGDDVDQKEFIRKRNAVYSKRKYHRKKIEIEVLKKQSAEMKKQNDDLKREGKRLEDLLKTSQARVAVFEATGSIQFGHVQFNDHKTSPKSSTDENPRSVEPMPPLLASPLVVPAVTSLSSGSQQLANHGMLIPPISSQVQPQDILLLPRGGLGSQLGTGGPNRATVPDPQALLQQLLAASSQQRISPPIQNEPQPPLPSASMAQVLSSFLGGVPPPIQVPNQALGAALIGPSIGVGMLPTRQSLVPPIPTPDAAPPPSNLSGLVPSQPGAPLQGIYGNNSEQVTHLLEQLLQQSRQGEPAPLPRR